MSIVLQIPEWCIILVSISITILTIIRIKATWLRIKLLRLEREAKNGN